MPLSRVRIVLGGAKGATGLLTGFLPGTERNHGHRGLGSGYCTGVSYLLPSESIT